MKHTHALIAVLALMSMTAAAQVAHARGMAPEGLGSPQLMAPAQGRAMVPIVGDRAHSKQTRCMALGRC